MEALNVYEIVKRGNSSRIANNLAKKSDFKYEVSITVAQNAPCWNPSAEGWKEVDVNMPLEDIGEPNKVTEIWIKTATLAGRRRMWIK